MTPTVPKTFHEKNFDRLKGTAQQVVVLILRQNPNPTGDQKENLQSLFDAMDKAVKGYCANTRNTHDVLRSFNLASTEWALVKRGGGNTQTIVTALNVIANATYQRPS